jgi:hypothetical protein
MLLKDEVEREEMLTMSVRYTDILKDPIVICAFLAVVTSFGSWFKLNRDCADASQNKPI